jgi:hypothetical protein
MEMGLAFILFWAFMAHASSISERFPDQKAIHQPGPTKCERMIHKWAGKDKKDRDRSLREQQE